MRFFQPKLKSPAMIKQKYWSLLGFVVALMILALSQGKTAIAQTSDDEPINRFGIIESYEDSTKADSLGVGWTRTRFQWADVQADGADSWTPDITDEQLDVEIKAGREVVGLLIGIPDWARADDDLPSGLYLPYDDPDNTWAQFVREAVSRYEGRIDHWIIWNEPDITDPETPGHTWDGDVADFVQLLRVAYLVAKETNPEAVIHLPAITYFWDPEYIDTFFDTLVAAPDAVENDYFFDVATAHVYFQPGSVYDLIQLFYEAMASRGIEDKPVWLVETNAPPIDDPYWRVEDWTLSVLLTEQAAFMPQTMASALAAGAERVAIYKLKDTPSDKIANPEPFGLVRRDGSRRLAFDTYRAAIKQFQGATAVTRERWDEIGQFQIVKETQTTTLLFSRLPQPQVVRVPALVEQAKLVNMWGKRLEDVVAYNGVFKIELPGATCSQSIGDYCMIGGEPFYLIQEEPYLPATATAPPTMTITPTVTVTPTVTATPTVHPTKPPTPTVTATVVMMTLPTVTAAPPAEASATVVAISAEIEVMSTIEVATAVATATVETQTTSVLPGAVVWLGAVLCLIGVGWLWRREKRSGD